MIRETTTEGPSVADAIDAALEEMGVQQDAVEYEILQEPGRGLFGGSGKVARVRVWLRDGTAGVSTSELSDETEEHEDGPDTEESEQPATPLRAPATPELTEEQLDAVADAGVATITEVLGLLGLEAEIDEYEGDEGEIILDIVGDEFGLLIGRHGRTLDALQVLVSAITNRKLEQRYPLVVDVSGYRHRRRLKLEEIAHKAAERAARQRRAVQLRPMTSFERRVVHVALREDRRVVTESEGEEPRRMVVVRPR
jgi:spoIIIJ-associated protein